MTLFLLVESLWFKKRLQRRLVEEGPLRRCDSCGREAESYYEDRGVVICRDCFKARRAEDADRDYWKEKARMYLERTERKNWRTR
jgi:ribosomal protein S14